MRIFTTPTGMSRLGSILRAQRRPFASTTESELPDISVKDLKVTLTQNQKPIPANKDLVFGQTFSDHMLSVEWKATKGWGAPRIHPYEKIALDPSATVFHYGLECFEDKNGKIRMFRPEMNMARLLRSCKRLTLPSFNTEQFLETIKELLKVDQRWIPNERGYSLYIRPPLSPPKNLLVTCRPSSKSLIRGFNAVSLSATSSYIRAWPGGTGDAKIGGNYAPGIRPQIEVAKKGYQQNLWLFDYTDSIITVGTMNLFVLWKLPTGETELTWGEFKVSERPIKMSEVTEAITQGRLVEMFGSGTAAIVSPIKNINYNGKDWAIPLDKNDKDAQAGPFTKKLAETIMGIQYGEIPHKWSVVIN
ncbi:aminotransferase [Chytridium lagenaria]|nr:aminotransferase [Chytridium lagenaria]